jgi:hypothetical protein
MYLGLVFFTDISCYKTGTSFIPRPSLVLRLSAIHHYVSRYGKRRVHKFQNSKFQHHYYFMQLPAWNQNFKRHESGSDFYTRRDKRQQLKSARVCMSSLTSSTSCRKMHSSLHVTRISFFQTWKSGLSITNISWTFKIAQILQNHEYVYKTFFFFLESVSKCERNRNKDYNTSADKWLLSGILYRVY